MSATKGYRCRCCGETCLDHRGGLCFACGMADGRAYLARSCRWCSARLRERAAVAEAGVTLAHAEYPLAPGEERGEGTGTLPYVTP